MCPMQVFDIEDIGRKGGSPEGTAVVARPRDCTMCRWGSRKQLKCLLIGFPPPLLLSLLFAPFSWKFFCHFVLFSRPSFPWSAFLLSRPIFLFPSHFLLFCFFSFDVVIVHVQGVHSSGGLEWESSAQQGLRPLHIHRRIVWMHPTRSYRTRGTCVCCVSACMCACVLCALSHLFAVYLCGSVCCRVFHWPVESCDVILPEAWGH